MAVGISEYKMSENMFSEGKISDHSGSVFIYVLW